MGDSFAEAYRAEIESWINPRRIARCARPADAGRIRASNELVGIALSGGGMRSASFSLGVTQALARKGLLADADYLSTVSGGGYLGTSLTALCAEPLPYGPEPEKGQRLGFRSEDFPYAFPGPRREPVPAGDPAPIGRLESPALRHVREYAKLLTDKPGLLDAETWIGTARYVASTVLIWLLFLLPLVTLGYLASMSWIPLEGWDRLDPLNFHGGSSTWISDNRWVLTAPLWLLAVVGLISLSPAWGKLWPEEMAPLPVKWAAQILLIVAAATAAAVLLVLGLWGFHEVLSMQGGLQGLAKGLLAAAGIGGGAAAGASARKLSLPSSATKLLPQVGLAVGGYAVLGLAAVAWYYFLWRWVYPSPDSLRAFTPGSTLEWAPVWLVLGTSALFAVITAVVGTWLLNELSIHRMYEQRIRRTWVISAVPPPSSKENQKLDSSWERTWVRPDLNLSKLVPEPVSGYAGGQSKIASPYPLWVTALNMAGSTNQSLLGRKSDGFVIAPVYCGSTITGWGKTSEVKAFRDMRLSTAATISGAAVSPNMGMTTHPTLAIAMTLFNVRLGMWVTNPSPAKGFKVRAIRVLQRVFSVYWNELGGRASHRGAWVYLSDGGHFENLGIYELLRRRCKYIIAIDATGEPVGNRPLNFGGIGIPLRMARTDFGVEVRIDLKTLERDPVTGRAGSYFAVGRIRYPKAEGGHGNPEVPGDDPDTGYLVLIKSGLVDHGLPPDVINYLRQENPDFPHDSTVDQQFSQPQFESYRQLGFIAGSAVTDAAGTGSVEERFRAIGESHGTHGGERHATRPYRGG